MSSEPKESCEIEEKKQDKIKDRIFKDSLVFKVLYIRINPKNSF